MSCDLRPTYENVSQLFNTRDCDFFGFSEHFCPEKSFQMPEIGKRVVLFTYTNFFYQISLLQRRNWMNLMNEKQIFWLVQHVRSIFEVFTERNETFTVIRFLNTYFYVFRRYFDITRHIASILVLGLVCILIRSRVILRRDPRTTLIRQIWTCIGTSLVSADTRKTLIKNGTTTSN